MVRHFLSIDNLSKEEVLYIFKLAKRLKRQFEKSGRNKSLLKNKTLAMIFEKPSLRTRVSFETGMTQLGGHAIYLGPEDIKMGQREIPSDIAKNLSRMVNLIMARVFDHKILLELADNSSVPLINGLSNLEHPCQALADLLTVYENKGKFRGLKIAYIGNCRNNVTHSLALLCNKLTVALYCASPKEFKMNKEISLKTRKILTETTDPIVAVKKADVVVTDTWISMGEEKEKKQRLKIFQPYQVNKTLLRYAKKDYVFLHCLPAYRNQEVAAGVIEGPHSAVFEQAENRLHVQKALMLFLLNIQG